MRDAEHRTTFAISPDVLYQQMGGEAVLLHLGNSHYYGLDEVGARFLQLLTEHGEPEATIPTLLEEYEVDESTLRPDIQRLLDELLDAGILVPTQ